MRYHQPLGQRLVSSGVLTAQQLQEALAHQAVAGGTLGSVVVELGFADTPDVLAAVVAQRDDELDSGRFGDLLVTTGLATRRQIGRALALQRRTGQPLGEVLVDDGVLTRGELIECLALHQRASRTP